MNTRAVGRVLGPLTGKLSKTLKPSWSVTEITSYGKNISKTTHVTQERLQKLAFLSRLDIEPDSEETKKMCADLEKMYGFLDMVQQVNTEGVEPMYSPLAIDRSTMKSQQLRLREDEVTDGNKLKDVLKNAKHVKGQFFVVPKVIGEVAYSE